MISPEDRISVKEAAEILGREEKAVRGLIHRKRQPDGIGLRSEKHDGQVWTTRAWIEEYLQEGRVPQTQREAIRRRLDPASQVETMETPGRRTTPEPTSVPEIIEELERLLARLRAVLVGR